MTFLRAAKIKIPRNNSICMGEQMRGQSSRTRTNDHSNTGCGTSNIRALLFRVSEIMEKAHGTPDLGNKVDPLDELLYILVTQRTRINLARRVFEEFRKEFHPWQKVLRCRDKTKLRMILDKGGRGNLRYRAVTEVLGEINKRVGTTSLEFLRGYSPEKARDFLVSLPWVGNKTAYCVMLYSLRHSLFPADSNIIRIFRRTGILEQAGIKLDGADHRTAQKKIAPVIPSEIAYMFHVNMVAHGRKVCFERNPRCHVCPIRLFCASYRNSKYREATSFRFNMVDLFSGAGGISYGFARAGTRPVLAVDSCASACETYALNIPWLKSNRILQRDITEIPNHTIKKLTGDQAIDILVAGVPCQGFSKVGLKSKPVLRRKRPPEKEAINKLFLEVMRWAKILRPSIILLENVPAMENSKILFEDSDVGVRELLEKSLTSLGYSTSTVYLNSADFGIPQVRKRLFFIASKKGIDTENFGERLHTFWRESLACGFPDRYLPLERALEGLPPLNHGEGSDIIAASPHYPNGHGVRSSYEEFMYDNPMITFNHVARVHNNDDMLIISNLQQGETYRQLVTRKPEVIKNRKRKVYSLRNFHDKFYRLVPHKPGRTIVSHLAKDGNSFIHPYIDRSLTVREAARIQSFPDSFMFCGSRTAQFVQVGNAVPPLLARIIGVFMVQLLDGEGTK